MQRCNCLLRLCRQWSILQVQVHYRRAQANTWAPPFRPPDSISGGSHILIKIKCWKLQNVENAPKERWDFLQPRPTLTIKSGIWAPTLWLILENPIAGETRVIQQLRAVNDRMHQIMNNKLDHKREEEGWQRRSRNVCTLTATIKLPANSWEENQATASVQSLCQSTKKVRFSFWKLLRMLGSKVILKLKSHRRGVKKKKTMRVCIKCN